MSEEKTIAQITGELKRVCNHHVVTESHQELSLDFGNVVNGFAISAATTKVASQADPEMVRELMAAKLEYLAKTKAIIHDYANRPIPAVDDATLERMADEGMAEANKPHLQAVQ